MDLLNYKSLIYNLIESNKYDSWFIWILFYSDIFFLLFNIKYDKKDDLDWDIDLDDFIN